MINSIGTQLDPIQERLMQLRLMTRSQHCLSISEMIRRRPHLCGNSILCNKLGELRLDQEGHHIVVIDLPLEEMVERVFLTKPDKRGNLNRARITELINKLDDDLELDPTRCQFKISFENNSSCFEDIMSYNDISDYVDRNIIMRMDTYRCLERYSATLESQERKE